MAIPSLAAMAALTLFHNPHMQPEDVSVPFRFGNYNRVDPATRIQRLWRRRRENAAKKINRSMRGLMARVRTFMGREHGVWEHTVPPNPYGRRPFRIEPMWVIMGNPLGDGPGAPWRAPSKYWIRFRTLNNARNRYFQRRVQTYLLAELIVNSSVRRPLVEEGLY